ncbi:hypothetical protein MAR_034957 [Mya arenaria]|uniref:Uncharacterized protein n=1 Tax=Mya arenaria TaxID=6604 RepID=A0ABY7ERR3_MYAAR|nr:hypothetical protein MAR_034957 [Mya arenaria]
MGIENETRNANLAEEMKRSSRQKLLFLVQFNLDLCTYHDRFRPTYVHMSSSYFPDLDSNMGTFYDCTRLDSFWLIFIITIRLFYRTNIDLMEFTTAWIVYAVPFVILTTSYKLKTM